MREVQRLTQATIDEDFSVHFPAIAAKRGLSVDEVAAEFELKPEHDLDACCEWTTSLQGWIYRWR